MDKHQQRIELLKKFVETRAAFKKRVREARSGQHSAEEETTKFFKPDTEAVLGKQPEISTLSPEELEKMKEKGLLGSLGKRSKEETKKIVEELVRHINDPVARQAEFDRIINNPFELQRDIARLSVNPAELKRSIENLSDQTKELAEKQNIMTEATVVMMAIENQVIFYRKNALVLKY